MGLNHADHRPALTSGGDPAEEVRASFQAILDALDATRADLHATEELQRLRGSAEEDDATGRLRGALESATVEPLWARGMRPEAVVSPEAGEPTASRGGPASEGPPSVFPTSTAAAQGAAHRTTDSPAIPCSTSPQPWGPPAARPLAPLSRTPLPPKPFLTPAQKEGRRRRHRFVSHRRPIRVAGVLGFGAVSGLLIAFSLLPEENKAPAEPPASLGQPDQPQPDDTSLPQIPGTGVLRPGDSGHGVYELQVRLLQIPHIYDDGAISGRYDTQVRQAVARFQARYGIQGDETGVYGDNTRHALMLRTK